MADEQSHEQPSTKRLNVYLSREALAMVEEMGRVRYPSRTRTDGMVVEDAIRHLYADFKRKLKREERES
jgi:hypothetical protein